MENMLNYMYDVSIIDVSIFIVKSICSVRDLKIHEIHKISIFKILLRTKFCQGAPPPGHLGVHI